jgi:outer membrane protein OmpA-like peptidoglycan-associated protein
MMLFRATLPAAIVGAAACCLTARGAAAQPIDGLYVGAGAGYSLLQDTAGSIGALAGRALGGGVQASVPDKVDWGAGYVVSSSIGYGFGNGLRLELEANVRQNFQDGSDSGRQTQAGVMGNVLYDVDVGVPWLWPYVGMGVGYQNVSWHSVSASVRGIDVGGAATSVVANQAIGGVGYQAILGVAFPVDSVPGLSVTAEYRYSDFIGHRNYTAVGTTPGVSGFASNATHVKANNDADHTFLIGLRYAFDMPESAPVERPPPAPEPEPTAGAAGTPPALPVPARTYLVFFDWDSAELTPRAHEIIAEAVHNSEHIPHTRIEVAGHADRSGTAQGNQVLSLRRAQAVAAEMVMGGVPSDSIDIHAYGDTRPLVPTAAGVRQRENRRVEIVYR